MRPGPATSSPPCCLSASRSSAPSTPTPWPPAPISLSGPGRRGRRPRPATSVPPLLRRPANRACRRRRSPRGGVGYVPQVDDVFAPLTVRENLEMVGYLLAGREVSQRIEGVVSVFPRLGQMLTRRAGRLSAGERKMLAMGRMLMLEPAVFLLDEPTANLAARVATDLLTGHVRAPAGAGAGCWSWSSGPGPCSSSPTARPCWAAARC